MGRKGRHRRYEKKREGEKERCKDKKGEKGGEENPLASLRKDRVTHLVFSFSKLLFYLKKCVEIAPFKNSLVSLWNIAPMSPAASLVNQ